MASFKLLSSECVPMTKELAEQFQKMEPSPTERTLDPGRLRMLREKAEAGLLVTFHWAKAKLNGKWLRTNGQHSSAMLCELEEFPEGLKAHVDAYQVDSPEGLALLFRQFDERKSSRSPLDVSGAYQMLYEPLRDVPRRSAKLAVEGACWYRRTIEGQPVPSGDQQYSLFNETGLHGFIRWVGEVFTIKTPEMRRVQVVSAMYASFVANEEESRRFWDLVAKGGHEYEDNHPATVLSTWLVAAKQKELKNPPKAAEFYQAGIYAWNAFREEKTLSGIRIDTKKSWLEPRA
jgi:hypothetical protein